MTEDKMVRLHHRLNGHEFRQTLRPGLFAEGSGAGGVQTAKASRKQSSLSGKESAQGCVPQRLLGRPD